MVLYTPKEAHGVPTNPHNPGTHRKWSGTRFLPETDNYACMHITITTNHSKCTGFYYKHAIKVVVYAMRTIWKQWLMGLCGNGAPTSSTLQSPSLHRVSSNCMSISGGRGLALPWLRLEVLVGGLRVLEVTADSGMKIREYMMRSLPQT